MRYFLKRKDGFFDEVDKWVFDNYRYAIDEAGNPLYVENVWIMLEGTEVSMQLVNCSVNDIAILARGLEALPPAKVEGGFIKVPESVRFLKRNKTFVRYKNGDIYDKRKAA